VMEPIQTRNCIVSRRMKGGLTDFQAEAAAATTTVLMSSLDLTMKKTWFSPLNNLISMEVSEKKLLIQRVLLLRFTMILRTSHHPSAEIILLLQPRCQSLMMHNPPQVTVDVVVVIVVIMMMNMRMMTVMKASYLHLHLLLHLHLHRALLIISLKHLMMI
jgi:hypothetical protein